MSKHIVFNSNESLGSMCKRITTKRTLLTIQEDDEEGEEDITIINLLRE